jgi:hypothetical protein
MHLGINHRLAFLETRDPRLLDMLDGAFLLPEKPPPCATHDFLVLNPHPDLTPEATSPDNYSGGL